MSHPVTLLPWYQNGTLAPPEHERVRAHLEGCAQCRAELESLSEVRQQVHAAMDSDAMPTSAARQRVMANIARSPVATPSTHPAREPRRSMIDGIAEALRSLMTPKWAPTAAIVLIAVQGGLLVWTAQTPSGPGLAEPVTEPPPVTSRSLGSPTARAHVQFATTATEADIRALLGSVRGRIVDGPSAEGVYVVEMLANDTSHAATKADLLRARTDIVIRAELLP